MLPVEGDCNATAIQWINVTLGCMCWGILIQRYSNFCVLVELLSLFRATMSQNGRVQSKHLFEHLQLTGEYDEQV